MAITYVIDKQKRLVLAKVTGVLTQNDVFEYRRQLVSDVDFNPKLSQLSDLSAVTRVDLTASQIRALAESNHLAPTSRRGFACSNELTYGLARMFEIIRGLRDDPQVGVFHNHDEALEWVLGLRQAA